MTTPPPKSPSLRFVPNLPALAAPIPETPQVIYLKGNPIVSKFSHYRKRLITALPSLAYLDDRPVFEQERRLSAAWVRGGLEGTLPLQLKAPDV